MGIAAYGPRLPRGIAAFGPRLPIPCGIMSGTDANSIGQNVSIDIVDDVIKQNT